MEKKILIACAMQQDEIEKYRKQLNITYPVVYLQRGLHRNPSVLRNLLQQEIDMAPGCGYNPAHLWIVRAGHGMDCELEYRACNATFPRLHPPAFGESCG